MNAAAYNAVTADIRAHMDWDGAAFVWAGTTYRCVSARMSVGGRLQVGGEWVEYAGRIVLAAADFTGDLPKSGDFCTVNGVEYQVERAIAEVGHPTITVHVAHGQNPLVG